MVDVVWGDVIFQITSKYSTEKCLACPIMDELCVCAKAAICLFTQSMHYYYWIVYWGECKLHKEAMLHTNAPYAFTHGMMH